MMADSSDQDPFLQVQQDVLTQISTTRPLFASYVRIRSLATSASSPELVSARTDLENALSALAEDLADLVASVRAVESDPARFGLSTHEVSRRNRLVQEVGGEIDDMRDELNRALPTSTRTDARDSPTSPDPPLSSLRSPPDDSFDQFEAQQQVQMMQEQDRHLDGVFLTVGNLRRQADDMGRELEEQTGMLEVVDDAVDRVGARLHNGMARLRHVVRNNEDGLSSCCIAVLIFVLILLLVLLLIL